MITQTKTKKTKHTYNNQNPLEILKGIGSDLGHSFVDDLGIGGSKTALESLLSGASGGSSEKKHRNAGDLEEGQEIDLKKHGESESREHAAPAMNYHQEIVEVEKRASRETQNEIHSKIQEILVELKKISETSTEIAMEFKEVTIEQRIEKPGEYHVNFFSWILSLFRTARVNMEDSRAGLGLVQSKGKQKQYWAMFKKHGTSFGLSNERVVATQVG